LAKERGILVVERSIKIKELFDADEVFLTATNKNIVPVVKIDGQKVAEGKVGKITQQLMEDFQEFRKKY
jgi:branched-subunit amino acid aminotransferase/4-amino-4-deoxychorismate lyase